MSRRRRLAVIWSVLVLLACGGYLIWPTWNGHLTAHQDLARGTPRLMLYGELAPYEDEANRELVEQHGLTAHRVAFCVVAARDAQFADAYNSVVCTELGLSARVFDHIVHRLIERHR